MTKKSNIACPHCGKPGTWKRNNKFRPFCSERCKIIDLGDWASEKHRVPGEAVNPEDIKKDKEDSE